MKILTNKVKCKKCGDVIESNYTHDFKWCSCKTIAVDGGKSYLKRLCKSSDAIEEMSETVSEVVLELSQDDGGVEFTLRIEDGADEKLITLAKTGMHNIKEDAFIKGYMIFELEFKPYLHQDYRYTIKVDSDYGATELDNLIEQLKEFDAFRLEY